jgi:hypothetical protein
MIKNCNICQVDKLENEFSTSELARNSGRCKLCVKIYNKNYRQNHLEKERKRYHSHQKSKSATHRGWYQRNKKDQCEKKKQYYRENNEKINQQHKTYYSKNKESILEYHKEYHHNRKKIDPVYTLRKSLSSTIYDALFRNNGSKNGSSMIQYLFYTVQQLKEHLENQFDPWMSWQNHGKYNSQTWNDNDPSTWTWQLDHIIPQSKLPYDSMEHPNFQKCWDLTNLRPLSAKQNLLDGNRREIT